MMIQEGAISNMNPEYSSFYILFLTWSRWHILLIIELIYVTTYTRVETDNELIDCKYININLCSNVTLPW